MSDEIELDTGDELDPGAAGRSSWFTPVRIGCLGIVVLAAALAVTNPSDAAVRQKIVADGWAPIHAERTDLRLFSYTHITGFTGAKATYVGIGGQVFGIERGR